MDHISGTALDPGVYRGNVFLQCGVGETQTKIALSILFAKSASASKAWTKRRLLQDPPNPGQPYTIHPKP